MLPPTHRTLKVVAAAAVGLTACSSSGKIKPPPAQTTTVVTAGAPLPPGSNDCVGPDLISASGTSTGTTTGNSDKHGTDVSSMVHGAGAPDAVWQIVLAKKAKVTVRSNGLGHFVNELAIAYAPAFPSRKAAPCGSPEADLVTGDNRAGALAPNQKDKNFTVEVSATLDPGPYLVWFDGDAVESVRSGSYQVSFEIV